MCQKLAGLQILRDASVMIIADPPAEASSSSYDSVTQSLRSSNNPSSVVTKCHPMECEVSQQSSISTDSITNQLCSDQDDALMPHVVASHSDQMQSTCPPDQLQSSVTNSPDLFVSLF